MGAVSFLLAAVTGGLAACARERPDLISNLPETIGGETIVYDVTDGSAVHDGWGLVVLQDSGAAPSAMTVATGYTSPALGYGSEIVRIKGVRGADLIPLMVKGFGFVPEPPRTVNIEGKDVVSYLCQPGAAPDDCGAYFYAFDDVAVSITGSAALIREALRKLP